MAIDVKPFLPRTSGKRFIVPPTVRSDFENYLNTDVPDVNFTFTGYENWYDQDAEEKRHSFRGEMFPINWKSKYAGSDNTSNLRVLPGTIIQKGDMLRREDGEVFLVVWNVETQVNSKKTQIQICNADIAFERNTDDVLDENFHIVEKAGRKPIAESIPCLASFVVNKFEYAQTYNTPGIVPNDVMCIYLQFNEKTDQIIPGDVFLYDGVQRRVVSRNIAEVDRAGEHGLLTLYAEKVAGEGI